MTRREFTSLVLAPAAAAIAPGLHLIAHRGGVVDSTRPENSPAAVRTAIENGYWMLEVDIRRSRDGEPVLYHDNNLSKYFGTSARVEDLTWSELRNLTSQPGGTPPLHFDLLCATCGDANMRLMLDLKGQWEPAFYRQLLRIMTTHKIPQPIWSLGGPRVRPLFDGHVMVSVNRKTLQAALDSGEPVAQRYFLFELGSDLDQSTIQLALQNKVTPAAAINTFRYTMAKRDEWEGPKDDIARLRSLGLRHYQVDSRYESLFA